MHGRPGRCLCGWNKSIWLKLSVCSNTILHSKVRLDLWLKAPVPARGNGWVSTELTGGQNCGLTLVSCSRAMLWTFFVLVAMSSRAFPNPFPDHDGELVVDESGKVGYGNWHSLLFPGGMRFSKLANTIWTIFVFVTPVQLRRLKGTVVFYCWISWITEIVTKGGDTVHYKY